MNDQEVVILYRNWQGEIANRRILPKSVYYGSSQWHPKQQWLLIADDLEKNAERHFALKDILSWSPKKINAGV
ncbi:hypothetical protein [Simkania sp.]|uniref:hypothetical protein n=1 Tax=Simkania sp. TaxID=34094 RepID=UPI003B515537